MKTLRSILLFVPHCVIALGIIALALFDTAKLIAGKFKKA